MTTLKPLLQNLEALSSQDVSKSKKSMSIYQSKRVIDDLQNSLEQEALEEKSSVLCINRQVLSGMIVDVKQFDESSKIKKQVLCRNGEENENILFSFLTLEEQKGVPTKVIYRWTRKPFYEPGLNHGVTISEEEHIYQGSMSNSRKHGEGEYIIIQKLSNATEKNTRYIGTWNYDIFVQGSIEDENGQRKQIKRSCISFKSKSVLTGKNDRNQTIKQISAVMEKKKDKSYQLVAEAIPSNASICEKVKAKKSNRVVVI